jgi:hypothetical protein
VQGSRPELADESFDLVSPSRSQRRIFSFRLLPGTETLAMGLTT